LKRSNRLVLLVGVFLAIVAFVGILVLTRQETPQTVVVPTTGPVVVATVDIPLSTRISQDQVTTKTINLTSILPGAFTDVSQVVGQIARQQVANGGQITSDTLNGGTSGQVTSIDCPLTLRCMALQVDQVSGVGTVIKTGDYVDMVVGFNVAVLTPDATGSNFTVVPGVDGSTVKLILQGMQVMGTLLPPPPAATQAQDPNAPAASPGTTLSGQQEIVILSVTAQQAEVIKFAQLRADPTPSGITLLLRSPQDFIDPATNLPFENGPIPDATTGVIFKVLVDQYGVLPPNIVEVVLPTPKP